MAKVFISHSRHDADIAASLRSMLINFGHEALLNEDWPAGAAITDSILDGLKNADVFIVLLAEASIGSPWIQSEIGAAMATASVRDTLLVIPVLLDPAIRVPPLLASLQYIVANRNDMTAVGPRLAHAIQSFAAKKAAKAQIKVELERRIEQKSPVYVDAAIKQLRECERRDRYHANGWYIVGFISLLAGVAVGAVALAKLADLHTSQADWKTLVLAALKTVVLVGFLGACAKYAFILGAAFASEARKAGDRGHAISFGRFYLDVFGANLSWTELKEVFQHWNIDRETSFNKLDGSKIDPKVLESIVDLIKAAKSDGK